MEPVIRRVIAARAANAADVDDLVQDCLERLLVAQQRLAPDAILPYAVVTARNLVSSNARTAMRLTAAAPRLHDASEPDRPEEVLLAGETRRAMTAALARLSDAERQDLLAYHGIGASEGAAAPPARGALRVRMARTRAKLRLEYLLAYRHLELPTSQCRGVLLAISAGDTRRQRELRRGTASSRLRDLRDPQRAAGPAQRCAHRHRHPRRAAGVARAPGQGAPGAYRGRCRGRCRGGGRGRGAGSPARRRIRSRRACPGLRAGFFHGAQADPVISNLPSAGTL